jgi:peptide/nickel transport system substrate-binding protein
MDEMRRRVDEVRSERSELENHLIDEYATGKLDRREFVRRGTVVGMSIPLLSFLVAACGGDEQVGGATTAGAPDAKARAGGTIICASE